MSLPVQITILLSLTAELFDTVPIERMVEAEKALSEAAANMSLDLCARFKTAAKLSDEDRNMVIEIARKSLEPFQKQSARALEGYYQVVELGLSAFVQKYGPAPLAPEPKNHRVARVIGAVVFSSDQGLVGPFNNVVSDYAVKTLAALPYPPQVWTVGERVHEHLAAAGLPIVGLFAVPNTVQAITTLVGQMLVESDKHLSQGNMSELHLFYNRATSWAVYAPISQRLLPLDEDWYSKLAKISWPTKNLAEVLGNAADTLLALIREYLFASLF